MASQNVQCCCRNDRSDMNPTPRRLDAAEERSLCGMLKRELFIFCENTTIRGVPRIVKARSTRLRTLWLTFVLILFFGCFGCMFFLAKQYLEYNVIHPPRILRDAGSPFPSVTICNSRPISSSGMYYLKQQGWKTPREFAFDVNEFSKKVYYEWEKDKNKYIKSTAALSIAGFLESLRSDEERKKIGHQRDKLVIKCQVTYLMGSKRVASPCEKVGQWREFIHANYLNCATYNLNPEIRNGTKTLEIYIYLDEALNSTNCPDCFHGDIKSQVSGALVSLDKPETLPDINDKSINLKPGTLTEIRLKTIINIQKTPPHGRCKIDTPKTLTLYNQSYQYSETSCQFLEIQNDIKQYCQCQAIEYPYTDDPNYPFCSHMPNFVSWYSCNHTLLSGLSHSNYNHNDTCFQDLARLINRTTCKISITEKYYRDVVPKCKMPCEFYSYETDRSTSTWPTKSWQLTWLNSYYYRKSGFVNRPEFLPYREAMEFLKQKNESKALEILEKTSVLERNLLAMLINRPNFNLHKVEEKEVLSLTSFLSQTGGLFSIWMGLTMISVVELIELITHCVMIFSNKRKKRNGNNKKKRKKSNNNKNCNESDVKKLAETPFVTANDHFVSKNGDLWQTGNKSAMNEGCSCNVSRENDLEAKNRYMCHHTPEMYWRRDFDKIETVL